MRPSDDPDSGAVFGLGVLLGFIATLFGGICAVNNLQATWEQEAVEKGKAEYLMNPKTGTTQWRWKADP